MDLLNIQLFGIIKAGDRGGGINSVCFLKDKRLASSDQEGSIVVLDRTYRCFTIGSHDRHSVYSLYALRNGDLLSSGGDKKIKIWKVDDSFYGPAHTLTGHNEAVNGVIELKDGKICSCSYDRTIKIWENYKCIKSLEGDTKIAWKLIEMNDCIISCYSNEMKIWDESTYQSITIIKQVGCSNPNLISKFDDNTLILAEKGKLSFVDIKTLQINHFCEQSLGDICCLYVDVSGNGLVFIGNNKGEILCYDSSSNQIIFKKKFSYYSITCIIGDEDNRLISCSFGSTVNVYNYARLV